MTDPENIDSIIAKMADELKQLLQQQGITDPLMIGIHTGGVWVAQKLHDQLGLEKELGTLDISFYRDDFTRIGMNPQVKPSKLPHSVDDAHIVLVDDVLHTGRTIRAAMNEIFDYGRPASVILVCLVDRPGRELPLQPNITGKKLDLIDNQHVKLVGPEPLGLVTQETGQE